MALSVLYFSRGRGKAHAVPDASIARELRAILPTSSIHFVSYDTGAATLRDLGESVIDLGLPSDNEFCETIVRASKAIQQTAPTVVISHEEFAAIPAAASLSIPSLFLTHWLLPQETLPMFALRHSHEIILMEKKGIFPEPVYLRDKIKYVGPMIRGMEYTRNDRAKARQELGISPDTTVISVLPGGWSTEARAPVADLILAAFDQLPSNKLLIWIAGADYALISERLKGRPDTRVEQSYYPLERILVATDLAVTKATYMTTMELFSLQIPSISLGFGLNPIDDAMATRIPTNVALNARSCDAALLHNEMIRGLQYVPGEGRSSLRLSDLTDAAVVAQHLADGIQSALAASLQADDVAAAQTA